MHRCCLLASLGLGSIATSYTMRLYLITSGILRFTLGDTHRDAKVGDYVVVPVGAPHTFANVSDEPVEFFSTFTPAYYVNYFRELAHLSAEGRSDPEEMLSLMLRYATIPC